MDDVCEGCGAACCRGYFTSSPTKIISLRFGEAVPDSMTQWDESHVYKIMKIDAGVCIALDKETNRCNIYENRPFVCRDVNPNSMLCQTSRRNMTADHGTRD